MLSTNMNQKALVTNLIWIAVTLSTSMLIASKETSKNVNFQSSCPINDSVEEFKKNMKTQTDRMIGAIYKSILAIENVKQETQEIRHLSSTILQNAFPQDNDPVALISRGKSVSQSSQLLSGRAELAIDGGYNQEFSNGTCSHTKTEIRPWWKIDLMGTHYVDRVKIWNSNSFGTRLNTLIVQISKDDSSWENVASLNDDAQDGSIHTIQVQSIGKFLRLILSRNSSTALTLCEVEIYGQIIKDRSEITYMGCFIDKEARDISEKVQSSQMSIEVCHKFCSGYNYMGLQYSGECWCGNSYGRYGRDANSACNYVCSGNKEQFCGGLWRNSVYRLREDYRYLGCFNDAQVLRDLPDKQQDGHMSIGKCQRNCIGFKFFGLQFGNQCFCGNSYGRHGRVSNTECKMVCSGNKEEYCGAAERNSIYESRI